MRNKLLILPIFLLITAIGGYFIYKKYQKNTHAFACDDCNIIIISMSNLRKQNMSLYGYNRKTTPNIDQFFADSFRFENAFAPASLTFTDAMSFFYSLQPNVHKFMNRSDRGRASRILSGYEPFTHTLKKAGYNTVAFVSDEDYAFENGFGKLFDLYFDKSMYSENGIHFRPWQYNVGSKDLIKPAVRWLESHHNEKFVMFLQLYDMHCPYTPDENYRQKFPGPHNPEIDFNECYITLNKVEKIKQKGKEFYKLFDWRSFLDKKISDEILFSQDDVNYLKNLYDAELANADNNLIQLFETIKKLQLDRNTIIVFMSEHGDYLGENGYFMKVAITAEGNLHNANLGFPLLIKHPELKKSVIQKQIVQTIDIAPTLLQFLGLEIPETYQGKSLLPVLGNEKPHNEFAYAFAVRMRKFHDEGRFFVQAIQNDKWKYTFFKHMTLDKTLLRQEEKLYLMPDEEKDVSQTERKMLNNLRQKRMELDNYYAP